MTYYADNLKKSIVTTHRKITQMIYDEIEARNAAYREAILRMAQEAGLVSGDPGTGVVIVTRLMRFAALVAAAEREACAKLAEPSEEHRREASWGYIGGEEGVELLDNLAAAIRARGET